MKAAYWRKRSRDYCISPCMFCGFNVCCCDGGSPTRIEVVGSPKKSRAYEYTLFPDNSNSWDSRWETLPCNQMPVTIPWEMDLTPPSSPPTLDPISKLSRTMSTLDSTKQPSPQSKATSEHSLNGSPSQMRMSREIYGRDGSHSRLIQLLQTYQS